MILFEILPSTNWFNIHQTYFIFASCSHEKKNLIT
jgi:hypothetical protein